MAIVACNEIHQGRGGQDADDFSARSTRVFRVQTDDPQDDEEYLKASGLLPALFAAHPRNSAKLARNIQYEQDDDGALWWTVTVEYSTAAINGLEGDSGTQQIDNPLLKPPEVSWEPVADKKAVSLDRNNNPIWNRCHDPFSLEKLVYRAKLKIVRNEASFDGSLAFAYLGRVNAEPFAGGVAETVMCTGISAQLKHDVNNSISWTYWVVTYEFEYDPEGWQPRELEKGYMHYVYDHDGDGTFEADETTYVRDPTLQPQGTTTRRKERIKDSNDEDVSEPQALDNFGRRIAPEWLPDHALYTRWYIYETADFSALQLGF